MASYTAKSKGGEVNYEYGQVIMIVSDAPAIYRPGALGAICSMSEENPEDVGSVLAHDAFVEVYTVEYSDGSSMEIPGIYISPYAGRE